MEYRGGARPRQRGRVKQTPRRTRLERLCLGQDEVLGIWACLDDCTLPFDNHQAERDLRLRKGQHKVTGCFRSARRAVAFACLRSYLSTLRGCFAKGRRNLMAYAREHEHKLSERPE